jgi:hypothetical protein
VEPFPSVAEDDAVLDRRHRPFHAARPADALIVGRDFRLPVLGEVRVHGLEIVDDRDPILVERHLRGVEDLGDALLPLGELLRLVRRFGIRRLCLSPAKKSVGRESERDQERHKSRRDEAESPRARERKPTLHGCTSERAARAREPWEASLVRGPPRNRGNNSLRRVAIRPGSTVPVRRKDSVPISNPTSASRKMTLREPQQANKRIRAVRTAFGRFI